MEGIRELLGRRSKAKQNINAIRQYLTNKLTINPTKKCNIINHHFASCGQHVAAKIPHSENIIQHISIDK